jgi:adenylate cyclase
VMAPVREALEASTDPVLRALAYGPLMETPVKNVARPLRHHLLNPA